MSKVHSNATKPEIIVRRWLWSHGYRYRLNVKSIPGKPDIVLRKYRTAIFVNGCFWHGHEGCSKYVIPKSNTEFWTSKIERNKERDEKEYEALQEAGWQVIVIWECQLKKAKTEGIMRKVEHSLNSYLLGFV
jgi:DNA mismatch endonuclease (patch repair protein)